MLSCGKHSIADWICSKTQTLLATFRTRNQLQEVSCLFLEVEHLFQSVGCARSKLLCRTVVPESEVVSLDAGLRMDGLLALDLWDVVIEVLHSANGTVQPKHNSIQETGATLHSKIKTLKYQKKAKG